MTTKLTDCLILKITEFSDMDNSVDTILYVFYDKVNHHFFIRGSQMSEQFETTPYCFRCEFANELEQFIRVIISEESKVMYELVNYVDLPLDSDDITFEYLKEYDLPTITITSIVSRYYSSRKVTSLLRMLRNVFNYY
jgi:cell division protein FtsI/penicillin-binding protein 2